jgi:amino acid adenylation domain-containing protein
MSGTNCSLSRLNSQKSGSGTPGDEVVVPASYAQKGLWILNQLFPQSCAYNLATAFRILGNLDTRVLEESLSLIVQRHQTLRTVIRTIDEQPMQFIASTGEVRLQLTDLRGLRAEARAQQEHRLITEAACTPFDLSLGPLVRFRLLRTGESEHVFVKVQHNIIGDPWSDEVFMGELRTAYEAFTEGRLPQLPDLQIEYRDFACLERKLLEGETFAKQVEYWRSELADLPESELPNTRNRPIIQKSSGTVESFELHPEVTKALRNLSVAERSLLFVTLLAAFKVLLVRYCGRDDIVVGVPNANRGTAGTGCLIGLFENPVVLRTKLDGDPTFRAALRRVQQTVLRSSEHVNVPFLRLAEELVPRRNGNLNPFFQVMFDVVKHQAEDRRMGGLSLVPIELEKRSAKFDLTVELIDGIETIRGSLNYNCDLFDTPTMRRMASHFGTLLEGIAANPDARLSELPLLTRAERAQLLVEWNNNCSDYPTDVSLHGLIEAQVRRNPDSIAITSEDQFLTYAALNRRANQVAHRLRRLGVGPDDIVGIFAERSTEMIIGLLGALKAGAAYLPLDPNHPAARLAFMLGDAQPSVVLTQTRLRRRLPQDVTKVLLLEHDFAAENDSDLRDITKPENLAYVIYTSGSTGQPKGVLSTHRGICNWLHWLQETYRLTADDRMMHKTPFTFDLSLGEIFWSLVAGSQLVVARPGLQGDSRYLIRMICENNITAIHFVPSMLSAFLEDENAARYSSLRLVICIGEALSAELQERFFAVLPETELHNLYGPTEAAVAVTHWRCQRGWGERIVPIGYPVANTQIYILDRAMQPVPIGVAGELYIGGVQLARGYLGRPDLTARTFVRNPFGDGRLYKTGDIARYRENGAIEFLGRVDHQVKLHGQRIELGEIETVLKKHEAVGDCVVVMRQGSEEADKRLVAYMVANGLSSQELRQHALKMLPDYMVPSAMVFLKKLPLTVNGKLDRRALPEPIALQGEEQSVPPRDSLEAQLLAIWEKALQLHPISITDNFFQLGGNSFLAVRVFVEIEQILGKRLPLATLFETPTVETLAERVRQVTRPEDWRPLVAIQLQGTRPPLFAIHGRDGNVLIFRKFSQMLGKDQPFYGLQAQGLDGSPITRGSVESTAAYYLEQIREVQPVGPYLLGGYSFGGLVAFEIARQLRAAGEEIALLSLWETHNPARAPRVRSWIQIVHQAIRRGITLDRVVQFLAGRTDGMLLDKLTRWNENFHKLKSGRAAKGGGQLSPELINLHVQMAHERASLYYRPLPYSGKVTLFRTLDQNSVYTADEDLGWSAVAQGGVDIHYVPGVHLTIFSEENVSVLAQKVEECIQLAISKKKAKPDSRFSMHLSDQQRLISEAQ